MGQQHFIEQLNNCTACPHACGVNRLAGQTGFCRQDAQIRISYAGLHHGEEPPLSGSKGSGTIFFIGCNCRCVFCQNSDISQEFTHTPSQILTVEQLADEMIRLQKVGAHNINFVSPSHMVYQMAEAILVAHKQGLTIPVVYNSNGFDSVAVLKQIRGLIDIYLPDLKYIDSNLAKTYSALPSYPQIVPGVLGEMFEQVGLLDLDRNGIAEAGLIIRHLVLPGALENSKRCLDLIASISVDIPVSLMSQYSPRYKAVQYEPLCRALKEEEYQDIVAYAEDLGFSSLYVQAMESQTHYLPDFFGNSPFEE